MADFTGAVRQHAEEHYNEDGWDYIVETYTDDELRESIGRCRTEATAIRKIRKIARMLDERHREICAEIF